MSPPGPGELVASLDGLEDQAAQFEQKLSAHLVTKLDELQKTADDMASRLQGYVGSKLDDQALRAGKIVGKLNKFREGQLSTAYSYAFPYGILYPTPQDVVYGLTTGDINGSMSVGPTDGKPLPISKPGDTPSLPGGTFEPKPIVGPAPSPILPSPVLPAPVPQPQPVVPPGTPPGEISPLPTGGVPPPPPPPVPYEMPLCTELGFQPIFDHANWSYSAEQAFEPPGSISQVRPLSSAPPPPLVPAGWVCWRPTRLIYRPESGGVYDFWLPPGYLPEQLPGGYLWGTPANGRTQTNVTACLEPCGTSSGISGPPVPPPTTKPPPDKCPVDPCAPPSMPVCPPPFQPACGPPVGKWGPRLNKDNDTTCTDFDQLINDLTANPADLLKVVGMQSEGGLVSGLLSGLSMVIEGRRGAIVPDLVNRFAKWWDTTVREAVKTAGCDPLKLLPIALTRAALHFVDKYTGGIPEQSKEGIRQLSNFVCQSLLPSGEEADTAFLADQIDKSVWECWHKAQGDYLEPAEAVMTGKRQRLTAREALEAFRRKLIDEKRYEELTRQDGVIKPEERIELRDLMKAWPAFQDVIRFMVRDVADELSVDWSKSDQWFQQKYVGKVKEWGEGLGLDDTLANYFARAHWQLPSWTLGTEMFHRLRPGEVPKELEVDQAKLRALLEQDDWEPGWIDRMIAVSFNVVTRVDARRMYQLHTIDEDQLGKYFQDQGYNQADAARLVEFFRVQRKVAEAKASGLPTARTLISSYAKGETTRDELEEVILKIAVSDDQAQEMLGSADLARDVYTRQQLIKGIKRQYVTCLIGDDEAHSALAQIDVDPDQQVSLVEQWSTIRKCRTKEISGAQLCKFRKHGLITAAVQLLALMRAGYSRQAATLITADCSREIADAIAAAEERREKEAERERLRREKEAKKCPPKPCPVPKGTTRNGSARGSTTVGGQ